jgi:hypothetical protein
MCRLVRRLLHRCWPPEEIYNLLSLVPRDTVTHAIIRAQALSRA